MKRILFVCTGNICRSPTADAVLRHRIAAQGLGAVLSCDSAGTQGYHIGERPDSRTIAAARSRGIDMTTLVARQLCAEDYTRFDVILGMDSGHLRILQHRAPAHATAELGLYLTYAGINHTRDVPDPYYDNAAAFERVLDLVEEATQGLLAKLT